MPRQTLRTISAVLLLLLFGAAAGPALRLPSATAPQEGEPSVADARQAIAAAYLTWDRARVERDQDVFQRFLRADFVLLLGGREHSRDEFLGMISREQPGWKLTRFESEVLTVERIADGWSVMITEKLEAEVTGVIGPPESQCSLWVTRDQWHLEDSAWSLRSSETVGHEYFPLGQVPPIEGW